MFNRLKNFETTFTITKAATIVGFFALLSKIVALIRDPLFTSTFGGNSIYILDIYNAAFRLPDFIFNLLILGTLSIAFIPVFIEILVTDKNKADVLASDILTLSLLGMAAIFLILYIWAYAIVKLLVPGFTPEHINQTVHLMRLIFVSQLIFTASNIISSVLNSHKKFIMAGLAPVLYNIGIIAGVLYFYPRYGIQGLGYGVIVGAILHLAIQIPELINTGFSYKPQFNFATKAMKQIGRLYLPRIFVLDISVFSLIIGTIIGSKLATGSISIFTLTANLQSIPVSVFALSIATAIFPVLSESYAKKDERLFLDTLTTSIIQTLFFIIPLSILMLVFRAHFVRLYYGHGKFSWENTILTFQCLGILSFSVFSQSLTPLLSRAFYARQNTITPVVTNIVSMIVNVACSYFFAVKFFPPSSGVVGLAVGFSIASIFNAVTLFIILNIILKREHVSLLEHEKRLYVVTAKILAASIGMGITGYALLHGVVNFFNTQTELGLAFQALTSGLGAIAMFVILAHFFEIPQAKTILQAIGKRIKRVMI